MRTQSLLSMGLWGWGIALGLGAALAACTMSFDDFEFTGATTTTSEGGTGNTGGSTGGTGNTGGSTGGTGNTGGAVGGGPTGGGTVGGGGAGQGGAVCGEALNPPDQTDCPGVCNEGCGADTDQCRIDCSGADDCTGTLTCPEGYSCTVACGVDENDDPGCHDLTIECPDVYACRVDCNGGGPRDGCNNVTVTCGTGVCSLNCASGGECATTTVDCGPNQCTAGCSQDQTGLVVNANTSCDCAKCGEACD